VTAPVLRIGGNGTAPGRSLWLWCPGCDDAHRIVIDAPNGWTWDGNEAAPTIPQSIDTWYGDQPGAKHCHCYVRGGQWQFLADCTHALVGQTVPMVPLPDWLTDAYVGSAPSTPEDQ